MHHEFEPTDKPNPATGKVTPAMSQLYINNKLVGVVQMPYSAPNMFGSKRLRCGYDGGDPVAPEEYTDAFKFTDIGKSVTLDLSSELIPGSDTGTKIAMTRQ